MMKSILDLSCKEFEERSKTNLIYSYSRLATFYREGPKSLIREDKKDSDALKFGSLVDCLMTCPEELDNHFIISTFKKPSFTVTKILDIIWEKSSKKEDNIEKVDKNLILSVLNQENYYPNWNDITRINTLIKNGRDYFNLLFLSQEKIVMSQEDFSYADDCVKTLKIHPFTSKYFTDDPFDKRYETLYQIKFTGSYKDIKIRGVFDRLIVDHQEKTIIPIDLKTTGKLEEEFVHSVLSWNYYIQAEMYLYMLQSAISKDDYFKDFTILPFRFIVINKYSQNPIVWIYDSNLTNTFLEKHRIKKWYELLQEAYWHESNNLFEYSYETYKSDGERVINLNNIFHE